MAQAQPLINGNIYSWNSIRVTYNGDVFGGTTEINYKGTRKPGYVWGTDPAPLGHTGGKGEFDGDITLLLAYANALTDAIGDNFSAAHIDITVQYREDGSPVVTDRIVACRLGSYESGNKMGEDPTVRKMALHPLNINFNGKWYLRPVDTTAYVQLAG